MAQAIALSAEDDAVHHKFFMPEGDADALGEMRSHGGRRLQGSNPGQDHLLNLSSKGKSRQVSLRPKPFHSFQKNLGRPMVPGGGPTRWR
jgi:hypothetical protein